MDSCCIAMGSGIAQLYGQANAVNNEAIYDDKY